MVERRRLQGKENIRDCSEKAPRTARAFGYSLVARRHEGRVRLVAEPIRGTDQNRDIWLYDETRDELRRVVAWFDACLTSGS